MRGVLLPILVLLVVSAFLAPPAGAQDSASYKVIVNEANPVSAISKEQLSRIFLGKMTSWDHGTRIAPVDLTEQSATRERFSKDVHGRTVAAVQNYWRQQIFSGRGVPPPEKASDSEVLAYVKTNPGAVGYVSADSSVNGVKVLTVRP
jgi:ABC-type phosphate transport system substrate-binding protein